MKHEECIFPGSKEKINQDNRYRALKEKLIWLKPNDWLKFQEQLKNLHLAEIQTQPNQPVQIKKKQVKPPK